MAPNWTYMSRFGELLSAAKQTAVESEEKTQEAPTPAPPLAAEIDFDDKSRPHGAGMSTAGMVGGGSIVALFAGCIYQIGAVETSVRQVMTPPSPTGPEEEEAAWTPYTILAAAFALQLAVAVGLWYFCIRKPRVDVRNSYHIRDLGTTTPYGTEDVQRQMSFPPPFPNGWYKLCDAKELVEGKVLHVEACGLNLAVFRGSDSNELCVLDAFCPHLGANMAEGGTVVGDSLECPFHHWRFGAKDGKCTDIPYSTGKIPEYARAKKYHARVRFQMVVFYYDADGIAPPYELPPVVGVTDGVYHHRGTHSELVRMHVYDFAENSADTAHFAYLHGRMMVPWTYINTPFYIHHVAGWELDQDFPWMMYFSDTAHLVFRGRHLDFTTAHAKITFMGPGSMVHFRFILPGLGEIVMFQTHTPIKPMLLRAEFSWWADPVIPRPLVWYVIGNWISQWGQDIRVWENKLLLNRPLLVRGDGPIMKLRRWYKQFLVPNSYKQQAHLAHTTQVIEPPNLGSGRSAPKTGPIPHDEQNDNTANIPDSDLFFAPGRAPIKEPAACTTEDW